MEKQLRTMLFDMQTCSNFGVCDQAVYDPEKGHVPRGFSGATGSLDEVYLVIVSAQPGSPFEKEEYSGDHERDVEAVLGAPHLEPSASPYHKNIRTFLDVVFQNVSSDFYRQLNHVWVTQSRHCSIVEEPEGKKSRTSENLSVLYVQGHILLNR